MIFDEHPNKIDKSNEAMEMFLLFQIFWKILYLLNNTVLHNDLCSVDLDA